MATANEIKNYLDINMPKKMDVLTGNSASRPDVVYKPTIFISDDEGTVEFWNQGETAWKQGGASADEVREIIMASDTIPNETRVAYVNSDGKVTYSGLIHSSELIQLNDINTDETIQEQLDKKVEYSYEDTPDEMRVAYVDDAGKVTYNNTISSEELMALDDVSTSKTIQEQLDAKVLAGYTTTDGIGIGKERIGLMTSGGKLTYTDDTVTKAELLHLEGLETNVQNAIDARPKKSFNNAPASGEYRVALVDASGGITYTSSVNLSDINTISGATSNIQNQIDSIEAGDPSDYTNTVDLNDYTSTGKHSLGKALTNAPSGTPSGCDFYLLEVTEYIRTSDTSNRVIQKLSMCDWDNEYSIPDIWSRVKEGSNWGSWIKYKVDESLTYMLDIEQIENWSTGTEYSIGNIGNWEFLLSKSSTGDNAPINLHMRWGGVLKYIVIKSTYSNMRGESSSWYTYTYNLNSTVNRTAVTLLRSARTTINGTNYKRQLKGYAEGTVMIANVDSDAAVVEGQAAAFDFTVNPFVQETYGTSSQRNLRCVLKITKR